MAHANTEPRSETTEIEGHVITRGCRYRPDLNRWEPTVSIRASWAPASEEPLTCKPDEFQDTPDDAMVVAQRMVDAWLAKQHPA